MNKPLVLRLAVFLFAQEGAKKGQTNYIVYVGNKQLLNNRLSIKNDPSFYPSGFIFFLVSSFPLTVKK